MTRHARREDPETSKAASRALEASVLATHKERVRAAIYSAGSRGMTWSEAENACGVKNCWRRCSDLRDDGRIIATAEKRPGLDSKEPETVWLAAEFEAGYDPAQQELAV